MDAIGRQLDFLLQMLESNLFEHSCQDIFCEPLTKVEKIFYKMVSVMTLGRFQVKNILIEDLSLPSNDSRTVNVSQLLEFIENQKSDEVSMKQSDANNIFVQTYLVNLGTDIAKLIHKYTPERSNATNDDFRNSDVTQDSIVDLSRGIKAEPCESEKEERTVADIDALEIKTENIQLHKGSSKRNSSAEKLEKSKSKVAKIRHIGKLKQKKKKDKEDSTDWKPDSYTKLSKKKKKKGSKDNILVSKKRTSRTLKIKYTEKTSSDSSDGEETKHEPDQNEQNVEDTRQVLTTNEKAVVYRQFICFICQPKENDFTKEYKTNKDLMQHILDEHVQPKQKVSIDVKVLPGKPYIECGKCDTKMTYSKKHLSHYSAIVQTSLVSSYWLVHHIKKHGTEIPYFVEQFKCDVENCNFVSVSKCNYTIHVRGTHSTSQASCIYCRKTLKTRSIPIHLKICEKLVNKSERKQYPCTHCEMPFLSKVAMEKHVANEHENKQEKVLCSICSKMLCDQNSMELHMLHIHGLNVSKRKVISCPECEWKGFRSKYNYHMKMKHPTEMCTCNICGKQFKNARYLKSHLASHSTEKKFKCQHCTFETTTALYLKQHSDANHLYPKKYSCPWCHYQTGFTGNMSKHRKICKQKHTNSSQNPEKANVEGNLKYQFTNISSHVSQPVDTYQSPIEIAPWRQNHLACDSKLSHQEAYKLSIEMQNVAPTTVSITEANSVVHEKVSNSQHVVSRDNQNRLVSQSSATTSQLNVGSHHSMATPAYYSKMDPAVLNLGPGSGIGTSSHGHYLG